MKTDFIISTTCRVGFSLALGLANACARPAVKTPSPEPTTKPLPTTLYESSVPLMPRAVTSFGAALHRGAVYAFGGYSGVPHAYNREGQSGDLLRLDLNSNQFVLLSSSEPTQGPALIATDEVLLRIGGMRAKNAAGQPDDIHSIDEVDAYVADSNLWSPWPALPAPRSSHAAAVVGKTAFVVGGWRLTGSAKTGQFADTMLALDLDKRSYRPLPQPFQLRALAAASLDGKLVVLGGISPDGGFSRALHVFDPATGNWSRGPVCMPLMPPSAITRSGDTMTS